ncbi:hypothetical protein V8C86DRAFT_2444661 [Haematococcus lacustris]
MVPLTTHCVLFTCKHCGAAEVYCRARSAEQLHDTSPATTRVDASDWDELCQGGHEWQPFLAHRFLRNLERSGSASVRRGWIPHHVLLYDGLDAAEQPAAPTYASDLPWSGGWLAAGADGLPSSPTVPDTDGKQRFASSFSLEEGKAGGEAGAGAGAEGRGGAVSEAGLAGSVWQYVRELGTWAQGVADMSSGWGAGGGGYAAGGAAQGGTQPPGVKPGRSQGRLMAAMPAYLKLHSNGEYVYDQSWASLADSLDVEYYPKLQACVPFVPVTGPRMLLRPGCSPDEAAALRKALVQAALQAAVAPATAHLTAAKASGLPLLLVLPPPRVKLLSAPVLLGLGCGRTRPLRWPGGRGQQQRGVLTDLQEFLMALKQSKRKNVRQERKAVARLPLRIRRLSGEQLRAEGDALWHSFYSFYQDTADRYWGNAYLTQDFFTQGCGQGQDWAQGHAVEASWQYVARGVAPNAYGSRAVMVELGRDMADAVVLVVAEEQVAATQQPGKGEAAAGSAMKIGAALVEVESERSLGAEATQQAASTWQQLQGGAEGGTGSDARGAQEPGWRLVAASLHLLGSHALFGRHWGVQPGREVKGLHMECCYYQAVEEALGRGLTRVEAGMQGEHKLQRGYLPAVTYSSHFLFNPHLKHVVAQSLVRERAKVLLTLDGLTRECSAYPPTTTTQALQRILAHLQQHAPQSVQQTLAALASVRALRLGFESERKASGQDVSSRLGPVREV